MICDIKSGKCVIKPSQKQCTKIEDCGNAQCIKNKCVFANFIVAFDTADLPDGWVECDGNNGTPDIQGKFIKGCDNTGSDLGSIDPGESSHLLKPEEAYHEHTIPAQELQMLAKGPNYDGASCFWDYSLINPPNNYYTPQLTTTMNNQTNNQTSQQTAIDLTPACISVIFATPLNNSANIFPIGTIIWLYDLGTGTPSLSGSDWEYYDGTSDNFFIGRDANHTLGKTFGNNKITLKQSDIPDHTHSFKYPLVPNGTNNCYLSDQYLANGTISCPDGNIFNVDSTIIRNNPKPNFSTLNNPLSSVDILPPYQPLFCIKKKRSNLNDIPIGSICAWNTKNIPKGWSICDGTNSTPDLRSKFILNKDSNDTLGGQGGSDYVTLVSDNIAPTHTHTYYFQQYIPNHNLCIAGYTTVSDCNSGIDKSGILFSNISMCDTNGSNCTADDNKANKRINLNPPHIKLIYIMKTN
jgi:microcystin-dependent protein